MIKLVNAMEPFASDRRRSTTAGTRYRQMYAYDAVEDDLVPQGRVDRYADIQSYRDDVDINALLARIGDPALAPYARDGFYGDMTDVPETIHDVMYQSDEMMQAISRIAEATGLTSADVLGCLNDDEAFRSLCSALSRFGGEQKIEKIEESEVKTDVEE